MFSYSTFCPPELLFVVQWGGPKDVIFKLYSLRVTTFRSKNFLSLWNHGMPIFKVNGLNFRAVKYPRCPSIVPSLPLQNNSVCYVCGGFVHCMLRVLCECKFVSFELGSSDVKYWETELERKCVNVEWRTYRGSKKTSILESLFCETSSASPPPVASALDWHWEKRGPNGHFLRHLGNSICGETAGLILQAGAGVLPGTESLSGTVFSCSTSG